MSTVNLYPVIIWADYLRLFDQDCVPSVATLAISAVAAAEAAATDDAGRPACCCCCAAAGEAAEWAAGDVGVMGPADMVIMASAAHCLEHTWAAALSSRACAAATSACSALPREVAVLKESCENAHSWLTKYRILFISNCTLIEGPNRTFIVMSTKCGCRPPLPDSCLVITG